MNENKKNIGFINSIYNGSAVDGPGIRCIIFFSGCNLKCPFCHNPENLYTVGEEYSPFLLLSNVLRYKNYIKNGGITLSGGEPFLQKDFVCEFIDLLHKNNINVAIETNGTVLEKELILKADLLIVDIKNQFDSPENEVIESKQKDFLNFCSQNNVKVKLTNVVIEGVNDDVTHLQNLKNLAVLYKTNDVNFLPFHKLCQQKYDNLNIKFPFASYNATSKDTINFVQKLFKNL
ncbi:MAG: 4Fe-4S cluster-binding domain-containing protein [Clostridia bacterium]